MASAGTGGEHGQAGAEDSYLRSLVDQLRSELEEGAALLASERQRWAVEREADRLEARDVVDALRVELESSVLETERGGASGGDAVGGRGGATQGDDRRAA